MSVVRIPGGPVWPLGFVQVSASGTPVSIMKNIDPNNNNAPWNNQGNPGNATGAEYTVSCKSIWLYGVKPGTNNNGLQYNTGNIYVSYNPSGNNNQNLSDQGAMIGYISPGGVFPIPQSLADPNARLSPYCYTIDADNSNDGVLAVLIDPRNQ